MPRPNRVTPFGELVGVPERGLVYGNRGCLHDDQGPDPPSLRRPPLDRLPAGVPRLAPRAAAAARPVHRAVLPGRGDGVRGRPPALCSLPVGRLPAVRRPVDGRTIRRRPGSRRSTAGCTRSGSTTPGAAPRTHAAAYADLPDGAMVVLDGEAWLVLGAELRRWDRRGLRRRRLRGLAASPRCSPRRAWWGVLAAGWSRRGPAAAPVIAGAVILDLLTLPVING